MKQRIIKISHESLVNKNLKKLKIMLLQNSYPKTLINKILFCTTNNGHLENVENRQHLDITTQNKTEENGRFGSLPNISDLSTKIIRTFQTENIKIAIKNNKKGLNLFSKLKDKVPIKFRSNVVYSIECNSCGSVYVGQTSQWLTNRVALHKSDITKKRDRCSLTEHALQNEHEINWENIKILETESNTKKRLILEMYQINKHKNTINKKSDTQKLSNIYTYLLSDNII